MNQPHDPVSEAAKRDLARLRHEGETLGGTAMDQATRQAMQQAESQQFQKPDEEDRIERMGRLIGRSLAFIVLPIALWTFGKTAGWW